MRFGPITERAKPGSALFLILIAAAGLLSGCERAPSKEESDQASLPHSNATTNAPAGDSNSEMLRIPAGRFMMGEPSEADSPPHEVILGAFLLDKYLVTQDLFEKVTHENPSRWKDGNNPVEQVRWSDAVRFCNKRSELDGLEPCYDLKTWKCNFDATGYRLPTEAEFEYACRAGTTTSYPCGDTPAKLGDFAWFEKNSGGHPRPVGQKQANAWGLYDMCGNLWEWCNDFYQVDYYASALRQDPKGPDAGKTRVVRGGSWRATAENCRSGYRYNENPGYADVCFGYDIYGFRCARKP